MWALVTPPTGTPDAMLDAGDERIVEDDDVEYRDRRLCARRELAVQVRVTPEGADAAHEARTFLSRDASAGGLAIRCAKPLRAGERVRLRFALPRSGGMVELDAVVAWAVAHERRGGMGLRFARVAPADTLALRAYLGEDAGVRRARVLVVDDDDALRGTLGEALRREGFETFESDWAGAEGALASSHALVVAGSQRGGDADRYRAMRTRAAPLVALVDGREVRSEWAAAGASCCLARTADARTVLHAVRLLAPR